MSGSVPAPTPIKREPGGTATRVWELEPRELAMLAGIVVVAAVIYLPSIRYGWVWDDKYQTVDARLLHTWSGLGKSFVRDSWWFRDPDNLPQSAYYRPFQELWFGLNYMLLGNHPGAWHFEKILLQLIGVLLCFRLAQLLTKNRAMALTAAAVFAVLPANVESVVWPSAIGEPLSTILEMGAMCWFIQRKPGWSRGLIVALMLYAGALLSHETAVLFWIVIGLYLFLIEGKRPREAILAATPFALLAVAYLVARWHALGAAFLGMPNFVPPSVALGWEAPHPPYGLRDMMLTAPSAMLTYLEVLALPGMAGPTHDVNWITRASATAFVSAGVLAAVAAIALVLIRRSRDRNLYLFCAAWALIALTPSMNLKALAVLVQDRILYAPSFAWSLAMAVVAVRLASSAGGARAAVTGAMAILLAAYAISVLRIERYWHDDGVFFTECLAIAPHKAEYIREAVDISNDAGDAAAALKVLREAVNREPDNLYLHGKLAQQYATMRRGADFVAEAMKIKALHAVAANGASAAGHRASSLGR
jgi:hypothetical protein